MSKHLLRVPRFLAVSATAGILLLSCVTALPAQADDAPPGGFPSWSDVENAKGNATATATEVAKISQLLDGLESEAGELGTAAVKSGSDFALTQQKLDAATAEVGVLGAQATRAAEEAAKYKKDAVAVAVQSYKSGGAGLGMVATISALESAESLNGMDMMHQVGEKAALKQIRATESAAAATALEATRKNAQDAQNQLTFAAENARDAAVAAQTAVTKQLDAKKAQSTTLIAQLASLNNTSASIEKEFRDGQDALAAYNLAQAAKREAAAEAARRAAALNPQPVAPNPAPNPGAANPAPNPAKPAKPAPVDPDPDDGYIPVDVLLPNIPGGAVNDPAGAKAYASSRLGAYGWAPSQFQCLVQLWERESNWRTNATNPYSGAYGIAQSLPPSKYASAGADWLTNYRTQINWGLGYIQNRYGSPCGAWGHSQSVGWY
ncbi:lytic transglycosylase domain-containing protein [Arthrobacter glacialis]|uniref:aggregation-promoting factor C-terminal-like domain-containing protein n=1 Tax=Arthrobacter glacialis TaxID=1664 RepID=UPI000CD3C735|nr:lytic transglycosylase domain-containing protein [Arthrobacter glacialis]POH58035.1 transglycosylase [Arthrobacter glacialis]